MLQGHLNQSSHFTNWWNGVLRRLNDMLKITFESITELSLRPKFLFSIQCWCCPVHVAQALSGPWVSIIGFIWQILGRSGLKTFQFTKLCFGWFTLNLISLDYSLRRLKIHFLIKKVTPVHTRGLRALTVVDHSKLLASKWQIFPKTNLVKLTLVQLYVLGRKQGQVTTREDFEDPLEL